jgi:ribulose-phosphate 3-epimerase
MCDILPGILEKDWPSIERKLELVKPFAKSIHVDILDGKFAPNTTFLDPKPFAKYARDFIFELHMMVEEPITYLKPWADAGFQRFIGHIERMSDQVAFVAQAQLLGEAALALDKNTPVDALQVPLDDLDALLIMTIQAGFSGQQYLEELIQKVKDLRMKTTIPIEVDGGTNDETICISAAAGATRFVATSFLFGLNTPESQFKLLQEKLKTVPLLSR